MPNLQTDRVASDHDIRESDETPAAQRRLDAAHQRVAPAPEPLDADAGPTIADDASDVVEPIVAARLRIQAGQLAGCLQQRRRELDRREADLNARQFQIEAEARASKLWLRERQHELSEREVELQSARTAVQQQAAGMSAAELASEGDLAAMRRELAEKQLELSRRLQEADDRQQEIDRRQAAVQAAQRQLAHRQAELERAEAVAQQRIAAERERAQTLHRQMLNQLQVRRDALERAAASLQHPSAAAGAAQTAARRSRRADKARAAASATQRTQWETLAAEQQAFRRRAESERRNLAARRQELEEQISRQRAELDEQRECLNRRAEANERLHGEIMLKHREALELRIIAEQLWSQMGKQLTPQTTQSFAALRKELTSAYRAETARIGEQRQEIHALADALDQQRQQLNRKRRELERWAARTRNDIQQQAARLVARQQRLEQREAEWSADFALSPGST